MSMWWDTFISKQEAVERVTEELMSRQKTLVELAVKSMDDFELTSVLNEGRDSGAYYNIDKSIEETE